MTRNPSDLTLKVTVSLVIIWHGMRDLSNANTQSTEQTCIGVAQPAS